MFEKWIDFVFNHPVTDPPWHYDLELDEFEGMFSDQVTLRYFTDLMSAPQKLLDTLL